MVEYLAAEVKEPVRQTLDDYKATAGKVSQAFVNASDAHNTALYEEGAASYGQTEKRYRSHLAYNYKYDTDDGEVAPPLQYWEEEDLIEKSIEEKRRDANYTR